MEKTNQGMIKTAATAFVSTLLLRATPGRKGLIIFNPSLTFNPEAANTAMLGISFNNPLPADQCIWIAPGEKEVADYITQEDSVYIMSDIASAPVVFVENK